MTRRAASSGLLSREVAINPFGHKKEKVQYELFKDELESRDPTSVEFYKRYAKYINPKKPHAFVDPPFKAQKYLKDSQYADPMTNRKLRSEINRLRKVLKLKD